MEFKVILKTKEELIVIAEDMIDQRIFSSNMLGDYDFVPVVFVPVGHLRNVPQEELSKVGMFYEYLDKAVFVMGPELPVFNS